MTDSFLETFQEFHKESQSLKVREAQLQLDSRLFNEKMGAFLKASGLPESFTIPELVLLAHSKAAL